MIKYLQPFRFAVQMLRILIL